MSLVYKLCVVVVVAGGFLVLKLIVCLKPCYLNFRFIRVAIDGTTETHVDAFLRPEITNL